MRTLRAALMLLAFLLLAPVAFASTNSVPAIGTSKGTITITGSTAHHGYTVYTFTFTETLKGTNHGTRVGSGTEIIYADGYSTFHDTGTFTGTIDGISGTAVGSAEGSGAGNCAKGTFVYGQGAGGLVGVHEEGSFAICGPGLTFAGDYWGHLHFG